MNNNFFTYETPIGKIGFLADDKNLLEIKIFDEMKEFDFTSLKKVYEKKEIEKNNEKFKWDNRQKKSLEIANNSYKQIMEYFLGKRKEFDLPIKISGTDFEKKVLEELLNVKYGQTISYKELSKKAGYERAYRATGSVMAKNPIPIVIPCHRVLKSDGRAGSYYYGTQMKEFLLDFEKNNK